MIRWAGLGTWPRSIFNRIRLVPLGADMFHHSLLRMLGLVLAFAMYTTALHPVSAAERTPHVLIIGIDGCRPDALQLAKTPNLDALMEAGMWFEGTDIREPEGADAADTISGPGWSNLLTGVWPDKHNVLDNQFTQPNYQRYPHMFARLKEARPEAVTASFSTWAPIEDNIVSAASVSRGFTDGSKSYAEKDQAAAAACAEFLQTNDVDLVVCYQGQVDGAGHAHGFHPTVAEYIAAIEAVDHNIGELLAAIQSRPQADQEDWLTIVCTDHGGKGTGHGGGREVHEIRRTFLIVSGAAAEKGRSETPTWQVDVVPTALAHLNVKLAPEWEFDGHAVGLQAAVEELSTQDLSSEHQTFRAGVAEVDITPPVGFPMAGYYFERLAEGTIDPLHAKGIALRDADTSGILVICDLIGIATDLSREVRQQISAKTGVPTGNIVIAATHSHTAPDYMKELYLYLGKEEQTKLRADYIEKLVSGLVVAGSQAFEQARPAQLATGVAIQDTPVAFNRRAVMRDGSVQTWQASSNPQVVRRAGPIDPEIGLLAIRDPGQGAMRALLSNFALHLDTTGGTQWSADYPCFIGRALEEKLGPDCVSVFATGCCGDINHVDPSTTDRNSASVIGRAIGQSITGHLDQLAPIDSPRLVVKTQTVQLPLQEATAAEVQRSIEIVELAKRGEKVDFLEHVTAHKKLMLDLMRHPQPHAHTVDHITWGLSHSLAGVGSELPVDVTVMAIGSDVAIVCLPGEVFVDLGRAIKQASPFRTTLLVELSNTVETIYVPHRAAYVGGSYEVTNSSLMPGAGELLVEAAATLLRQAASEVTSDRR